MFLIASKMLICLIIAAILGFILGFLACKLCKKCGCCCHDKDESCCHDESCNCDAHKDEQSCGCHSHEDKSCSSDKICDDDKTCQSGEICAEKIAINDEFKPVALNLADTAPDDLKVIKGIGNVIEKSLNALGIYKFEQIANWNKENIEWVDGYLAFKGRIYREEWVEQAKLLVEGKTDEFNAKYAHKQE
ncbi:hypothetical protein [Campylobacter geochelonis]|uniref:NADH dehydrogenase subunit E n=1 Tax=Campylobacter geochelonis TaxID=1780362 RepID=A0A128EF86_9BACT|nr:hypothetical protein [Campylobacter geochelonis]QKF72040.1 hypothetical protein CGEO_1774 [Campylobacter geochelonis]CZE45778.1 NADH dehydrogenase subunit E [Campylobacter geochelonis]CZE46853.1 NADH dehydrogenase subunit E [Campylobacter geochelonis]CZE49873.1 NADH dehydrogenase subunit E [Campylobacter geochelonis]